MRFPSNGFIVRDRDHLFLVDTAWSVPLTQELLGWIDDELHVGWRTFYVRGMEARGAAPRLPSHVGCRGSE